LSDSLFLRLGYSSNDDLLSSFSIEVTFLEHGFDFACIKFDPSLWRLDIALKNEAAPPEGTFSES